MDKWSKEKLLTEMGKQSDTLKLYQTKLSELINAYKNLDKEKKALESSLKVLHGALENKSQVESLSVSQEEPKSSQEIPDQLVKSHSDPNVSTELITLMNSLAVLSGEKCRMEATFQADKKRLREEKEQAKMYIKELQERLERNNSNNNREIKDVKSKLIVERHEREKERNDHAVMMRELQRLLSQEKDEKERLEKMLSEIMPKYELLTAYEANEADRQAQELVLSESFMNLQKKHLIALEVERKRVQQIENEYREQKVIHEHTVADLEKKLAELSQTVANYHRLGQQDQKQITKLKIQVDDFIRRDHVKEISPDDDVELINEHNVCQAMKNKSETEVANYIGQLMTKLLYYKRLVLQANEYCEKPVDIQAILCDKCLSNEHMTAGHISLDVHQKLLSEVDVLKQQCLDSTNKHGEVNSLKIKVRVLTDQTQVLNEQLEETVDRYEKQLEVVREQNRSIHAKHENEIRSLHQNYKAQIIELENQVQKQRERTVALLDEKEQEVSTLKSSFQLFVPGNKQFLEKTPASNATEMKQSQLSSVLDGTGLGSRGDAHENPHILHYAHELARRDIDINNLRKTCCHLEGTLRQTNKELVLVQQANEDKVTALSEQIARLERCQSREGANLEYLKNVIVNYIHSKDSDSRRHMLNAIAAVLKFSESEMKKIKNTI